MSNTIYFIKHNIHILLDDSTWLDNPDCLKGLKIMKHLEVVNNT